MKIIDILVDIAPLGLYVYIISLFYRKRKTANKTKKVIYIFSTLIILFLMYRIVMHYFLTIKLLLMKIGNYTLLAVMAGAFITTLIDTISHYSNKNKELYRLNLSILVFMTYFIIDIISDWNWG